MLEYNIYSDIAERTGGDLYLGVVGPVRTGKSTFIKNFMNMMVIPNIENEHKRERAMDELPQSAGGRMIMTTEPKFIPNEAVEIHLEDNLSLKVRLIDCVGYIVDSALGYIENDNPRMVMTPWSDTPIPFAEAAETGTRKVICEHSTVGIVVTTDGSITDIDKEDYAEAEERVISELKALGKPFIVILNTLNPTSERTEEHRKFLEEKYGVPVLSINCMELCTDDINAIVKNLLLAFPISEVLISLPEWADALENGHPLKSGLRKFVTETIIEPLRLSDANSLSLALGEYECVDCVTVSDINMVNGTVALTLNLPKSLFYDIIDEMTGFKIDNEESLMHLLREMADIKKKYDKVASALLEVSQKGYGIVSPSIDELTLEEPEIVKQGSRFGVRLKASAPSIHMIRADIETEVSPIVGTEKQSEELVHYLLNEFEVDPKKIWESNIFGKSLHELVNEGLHNKLYRMPDDAQMKMQETLQKIINEGSGGLICIIL
ncbi:MAG: stage IV sporulation protein A [Ruminococcaceae bacterium]|nr:stage IV sporulation protein A [Oscillospiraceae bacterium]